MDQTAVDYSHMQGGMSPVGMVFALVIYLGIWALMWWKVMVKAGRPGWYAIIPFFNIYQLIKIAGKPGWWLILMFIPVANIVFLVMFLILVPLAMSKNFGQGGGFAVGLILLPIVFYPILGFGGAQYSPQAA
jgi:hypothetical protein